jgi:hypothetical protein
MPALTAQADLLDATERRSGVWMKPRLIPTMPASTRSATCSARPRSRV